MQKTVNNFQEKTLNSKQIQIYSKRDVQRAYFVNVEIDFINAGK